MYIFSDNLQIIRPFFCIFFLRSTWICSKKQSALNLRQQLSQVCPKQDYSPNVYLKFSTTIKKAKLPEPEFHTDGMFTVVLKRKQNNYATNDIVNDIVNENEQAIIILLRAKPGLNASEIAESISKSWRTTMRYLKSLNEKGLIEFRGAPKTGGYYIKD